MERKKEKHEKKIDKALHLAEERLELLDTIKEMVETEVDKQMKKVIWSFQRKCQRPYL